MINWVVLGVSAAVVVSDTLSTNRQDMGGKNTHTLKTMIYSKQEQLNMSVGGFYSKYDTAHKA